MRTSDGLIFESLHSLGVQTLYAESSSARPATGPVPVPPGNRFIGIRKELCFLAYVIAPDFLSVCNFIWILTLCSFILFSKARMSLDASQIQSLFALRLNDRVPLSLYLFAHSVFGPFLLVSQSERTFSAVYFHLNFLIT